MPLFDNVTAAILVNSTLAIHLGAVASLRTPRSVKERLKGSKAAAEEEDEDLESISWSDAILFPVIASIALTTLYLAFKYLDKALLNRLLNAYLSLVGCLGMSRFFLHLKRKLFGNALGSKTISLWPDKQGKAKISITVAQIVCTLQAIGLSIAYLTTKHWMLANLFGLSFSFNAISLLKLDSFKTGSILLAGLFVYDVVMVFYTPMMVSVAQDFEAPVKMVWPRPATEDSPAGFAMLGLGDIVLPGIFIALALRFDYHLALKTSNQPLLPTSKYSTFHYKAQMLSYVSALLTTIFVMHRFKHAQPALLYIAPACILGAVFSALLKGDLKALWQWVDKEAEKVDESREKAE